MKVRYYLRGLGLGILITTVFFLLGDESSRTMSDEMIKQRAKELGMVESTVLANIGEKTKETEESSIEKETVLETVGETMEEMSSETETVEETSEEEEGTREVETKSTIEEETATVLPGFVVHDDMISVFVYSGEQFEIVSQRLFEAGLIEDPHEYNLYMMQNDYDNKIRGGEHLIPKGAGWQEIAEILMRRS